MDVLGVVADADACVVAEDADDRGGDGRAHHVGGGGVVGKILGDELGGLPGPRPERPHDLGDRLDLAGSGGPEGLHHGGHQLGVGTLVDLHLELAEPAGQVPTLEHRDLVVDHLGQALALCVEQLDPAPAGAEPGGRHEGGGPACRR